MHPLFGKAFFAILGAFVLAAAVFNWEFFMNHRKAQFMIGFFGRNGARIVYGILGFILILFSMALLLKKP
jgi:di/tricarboxylate transporter